MTTIYQEYLRKYCKCKSPICTPKKPKSAAEIRVELRELKQKQREYRKTQRFRKLGGLGDPFGFKIDKLEQELVAWRTYKKKGGELKK